MTTKATVFKTVRQLRSASVPDLAKQTGISQRAARDLLKQLAADGFVRFESGVATDAITEATFTPKERDEKVLALVPADGATTTREIASIMDTKPGLVYLSLLRLARVGAVKLQGTGRSARWTSLAA